MRVAPTTCAHRPDRLEPIGGLKAATTSVRFSRRIRSAGDTVDRITPQTFGDCNLVVPGGYVDRV
jgi:hypothetical protein